MAGATIQDTPRSAAGPWQKRLIWTGVMILAAGASYVTGRIQTAARVDQAEKAATQQNDELATQKRLLLRYEARRRLHLVLIALEAQNFGIAKEHQAAAARLLLQSQPEHASELFKLQDVMTKYQLVAKEDLSTERAVVLEWAKRLDQVLSTNGLVPSK